MFIPMTLVVLVFIMDYYIEGICINHLEVARTARLGTHALLVCALVFSCLWNHPFVGHITNTIKLRDLIAEEHVLSGGVIFSFVLFISGRHKKIYFPLYLR